MLNRKLQDKILCSEIRKRTKITDIIEYTLKHKWRWAGNIKNGGQYVDQTLHSVATKEREETKGTTKQKMARRHSKEGGNYRQETMEGIGRGLHPAVDGQSLGER